MRFIIVISLLFLYVAATGWKYQVTPATDLQAFFHAQQSGWLGADFAGSYQLSEDTYLWFWGDTLIGNLLPNGSRNATGMPRNSMSVMKVYDHKPGVMQYYIRYNHTNGGDLSVGFFTPANRTTPFGKPQWYWPGPDSVQIIDGQLIMFAGLIFMNTTGTWGFAGLGTVVIHVYNPYDDPWDWHFTAEQLPGTTTEITWGSMLYRQNDTIYIFGTNDTYTTLARIDKNDLLFHNWDAMEYLYTYGWSRYNSSGSWKQLFWPASGTTIGYSPLMNLYYIPLMTIFAPSLYMLTAPSLEGPWNCTEPIYDIPAPWNGPGFFSYGAMIHNEFATGDHEIIVSYNTNGNWSQLMEFSQIYVPEMLRIIISPADTGKPVSRL